LRFGTLNGQENRVKNWQMSASNSTAQIDLGTCKTHKPKEFASYSRWLAWAQMKAESGENQKQCPKCKRWFFACEM